MRLMKYLFNNKNGKIVFSRPNLKVNLYLKYQFFLLIDFARYYITIKNEFYVLDSNSFKVLLIQQNVTTGSLRFMS
jgi:hypothetical protein